jgi:uncharacterized protein (TIGR03435 family)
MTAPTHIAALLLMSVPVWAQAPVFETASIKLNNSGARPWLAPPVGSSFTATNVTLKLLIPLAWHVPSLGLTGGPSWITTQGFDVTAKAAGTLDTDRFGMMMQNLLKDRFNLQIHEEKREAQIYVLIPAKTGLHLPNASLEPCFAGIRDSRSDEQVPCDAMNVTPELIADDKVSMAWFASVLSGVLGRPVVDKTGFAGSFRVRLEFAPMANSGDRSNARPSLFSALQEQLGLRLESQKEPAGILVIDHAEKPSEN